MKYSVKLANQSTDPVLSPTAATANANGNGNDFTPFDQNVDISTQRSALSQHMLTKRPSHKRFADHVCVKKSTHFFLSTV